MLYVRYLIPVFEWLCVLALLNLAASYSGFVNGAHFLYGLGVVAAVVKPVLRVLAADPVDGFV